MEAPVHLGHACAQASSAHHAPVACGQGVAQPLGDGVLVDAGGQVDIPALVHAALHVAAGVPGQLAEEHAEEVGQQRPAQIQALVGVVIPVILAAAPQRHQQQPMDHVAEEVGLRMEQ